MNHKQWDYNHASAWVRELRVGGVGSKAEIWLTDDFLTGLQYQWDTIIVSDCDSRACTWYTQDRKTLAPDLTERMLQTLYEALLQERKQLQARQSGSNTTMFQILGYEVQQIERYLQLPELHCRGRRQKLERILK